MARLVVSGLVLALLCAAVAAPAGTAAPVDQQQGPGPLFEATQGEFDSTEFDVTVYANGSARWTFQFKKELANESEKEQFRDFAGQFNTQSDPELFVNFKDRAASLTRQGTNVTGREMAARDFSKLAETRGPTDNLGVVEMSFVWTNFGAQDGDRVIVSDVFEGGFYIGSNQNLFFFAGPDLVFEEVTPTADETQATSPGDSEWIRYNGEQEFAPGRPRVVFGPPTAGGTTTSPAGPTSPGTTATPTPGGSGMLPWIALALVVVLSLGGAVAYRSGAFPAPGGDDGGDGGPGAAAESTTTDGPSEPAVPDEELLSDEDRVMQLLEENGGRMKQVNIVEETGWSKSKVSMLLSEMEDGGDISKLRVGRENIISLKGQEPDAAGSPFRDEEE